MTDQPKPARIRLGMVGGGRDAFIGAVHRIASRIDDHYELVAGAFSSTPDKSTASAADIGVAADRAYSDYKTMASAEAQREDGIRDCLLSRGLGDVYKRQGHGFIIAVSAICSHANIGGGSC